jgi:hypothetical protein
MERRAAEVAALFANGSDVRIVEPAHTSAPIAMAQR